MTSLGIDNAGKIVVKNRAYRRHRVFAAELDNLPKHYYTQKQTFKRKKKNGKVIKKRKKQGQ